MNNKKLLGKKIKEIRKMRGLTQEQLAELIGIETSSLSAIESGRHFPSLPTLEKIAENLDVELKLLFDFNNHKTIEEIKSLIVKSLDSVDKEKLVFIYKFLDGYK